MPDMFAHLIDDLVEFFVVQARITPRDWHHARSTLMEQGSKI